MSTNITKVYTCNFCGRNTVEPVRWFKIVSLPQTIYGNQKRQDIDAAFKATDFHACEACGETTHLILLALGILHEYEPIPKEGEPWEWGRILVT